MNQLNLEFVLQKDHYDLRNIDPDFVREAIPNSVIKSQGIGTPGLGENVFQGFSYVPTTITNF